MGHTYHCLYIHCIFAVKYREALINPVWKVDLCSVVSHFIQEIGCYSYIVNGVEDHIHCFFRLKPSVLLSDVMRDAKAKSSQWVNQNNLVGGTFRWQAGYAAFSYSQSQFDSVVRYIERQEEHHKTTT